MAGPGNMLLVFAVLLAGEAAVMRNDRQGVLDKAAAVGVDAMAQVEGMEEFEELHWPPLGLIKTAYCIGGKSWEKIPSLSASQLAHAASLSSSAEEAAKKFCIGTCDASATCKSARFAVNLTDDENRFQCWHGLSVPSISCKDANSDTCESRPECVMSRSCIDMCYSKASLFLVGERDAIDMTSGNSGSAYCNSFACPAGWKQIIGAEFIVGSWKDRCCEETCSNFICPDGSLSRKTNVVGKSDRECCDPVPCSRFLCPPGYLQKPTAGFSEGDCCYTSCETFKCSIGYHRNERREGSTQEECCSINKCTCENGQPATGESCTSNESPMCDSCDCGFQLTECNTRCEVDESVCGASEDLGNFLSKDVMAEAGWRFDNFEGARIRPKEYMDKINSPTVSFWAAPALSSSRLAMEASLLGKGSVRIGVSNCCGGTISVYLIGKDSADVRVVNYDAQTNGSFKEVGFNFSSGDLLKIEARDGVLILDYVTVSCPGTSTTALQIPGVASASVHKLINQTAVAPTVTRQNSTVADLVPAVAPATVHKLINETAAAPTVTRQNSTVADLKPAVASATVHKLINHTAVAPTVTRQNSTVADLKPAVASAPVHKKLISPVAPADDNAADLIPGVALASVHKLISPVAPTVTGQNSTVAAKLSPGASEIIHKLMDKTDVPPAVSATINKLMQQNSTAAAQLFSPRELQIIKKLIDNMALPAEPHATINKHTQQNSTVADLVLFNETAAAPTVLRRNSTVAQTMTIKQNMPEHPEATATQFQASGSPRISSRPAAETSAKAPEMSVSPSVQHDSTASAEHPGVDHRTRPPSAVCGSEHNLNNFRTKDSMQQAGWMFRNLEASHAKHPDHEKDIVSPESTFWAWSQNKSLEMHTVLHGQGTATVGVTNCCDGNIGVYHNMNLVQSIDFAPSLKKTVQDITFQFQDGDLLKVDGSVGSVLVLNYVRFECLAWSK